MNILTLSDIHGRIPLMFRLIYEFQAHREIRADLVLVCGDLGVWPLVKHLDQSTRKYCKEHPEELGYQVFEPFLPDYSTEEQHRMYREWVDSDHLYQQRMQQIKREKQLLKAIKDDVTANIVFIGGNHEDYQYLYSLKSNDPASPLLPVENNMQINWLPPRSVLQTTGPAIAGISGIDPKGTSRNMEKYHPGAVIHDDLILEIMIESEQKKIDILLTHDSVPDAVRFGLGSESLSELLHFIKPVYHFFGHYHTMQLPLSYADLDTQGIHIYKLAFEKNGYLRDHVLGFLQWNDRKSHRFEFVKDEWLNRIRHDNWWRVEK